jgi:hypothetical protein
MNLLDTARIKRHWPDSGKVIPGTNCFEKIAPEWGPPQIQIYDSEHAGRIMEWVNTLLIRPDVHVCAVSPAAVCALRESDSMSNPLLIPHFSVTVIYQERLPVDAAPILDDDGHPRWNADGTRNH